MDELLANLNTDAPMFDAPSVLGSAFDMDSGFISEQPDAVDLYTADMGLRPPTSAASPTPAGPPPALQLAAAEIDYLAADPDTDAVQSAKTPKSAPNPTPPNAAATAAAAAAAAAAKLAASPHDPAAAMFADVAALSAAAPMPGSISGSMPSSLSGSMPGSVPGSMPGSALPAARASPKVAPAARASLASPPASLPAHPLVPDVPDTPAEAERRALRPLASTVVAESWRAGHTPAAFVAAVRTRLPLHTSQMQPQSIVEESSRSPQSTGPLTGNGIKRKSPDGDRSDEVLWQLPEASEGAVLDALFERLVKEAATSTRLMSYLRYSLVTGIISQRATVATCLKWIAMTPTIADRVLQSFAKLMLAIIPHYHFSNVDQDLTAEVREFLGAFTMIMKCTAKSPSCLAPDLVSALKDNRVVALVRACARRVPSVWTQIDAAIVELESPSKGAPDSYQHTFTPRSAYAIAPQLRQLIRALKHGLSVGTTSLESITESPDNVNVLDQEASLPTALSTVLDVTSHIFGSEVAKPLRDLWNQREPQGGDYQLLLALERAAKASPNHAPNTAPSYSFKNKVLACEAMVRYLGERAAVPDASDKWKSLWGGKERLKRIISDAVPQIKNEIRSESGALLAATAVTCCAAMCLGPTLRMAHANDGVDPTDPAEAALQEAQDEEVEDCMGELIGFAVGSLEDAATAEEIPSWRSFGLWLLLLLSRAGSVLRASGCEHARAARVLRAWGGMPTGTPGSHTQHSSSHKHSGQSGGGHQHQHGSSSSWAMSEGVTMFASSASLAIIDVSDASGSDETIRALCDDLVQ